MKSLSSYVSETLVLESVINLFDNDRKKSIYAEQVWSILQSAYASQGGILANGFSSIDDMINNIPLWKLNVVDDTVNVAIMYKFSEDSRKLRKLVALGINRDNHVVARKQLKDILKSEFSRSILEISGKMLEYMQKEFPSELSQYAIPASEVSGIISKQIAIIDKYRYSRDIGGHLEIKQLFGNVKSRY